MKIAHNRREEMRFNSAGVYASKEAILMEKKYSAIEVPNACS